MKSQPISNYMRMGCVAHEERVNSAMYGVLERFPIGSIGLYVPRIESKNILSPSENLKF